MPGPARRIVGLSFRRPRTSPCGNGTARFVGRRLNNLQIGVPPNFCKTRGFCKAGGEGAPLCSNADSSHGESAGFQRLGGTQEQSGVIFVGGLGRGLPELPGHFQQIRGALRFPGCRHLLKTIDRRRGFAPIRRRGVIENGGLPLLARRGSILDWSIRDGLRHIAAASSASRGGVLRHQDTAFEDRAAGREIHGTDGAAIDFTFDDEARAGATGRCAKTRVRERHAWRWSPADRRPPRFRRCRAWRR